MPKQKKHTGPRTNPPLMKNHKPGKPAHFLKLDPRKLTAQQLLDCAMGAHLAASGWKETARILRKEMDRRIAAKKRGK